MATAAQIRAWARDVGLIVPPRGTLSDEVIRQYEAANGTGEADAPDSSSAGPPPADTIEGERKPRQVGGGGRRRLALPGRGKDKPAGKSKGRAKPRVPVDKIISGAWGLLATLARPLPPTSRLLRLEAPVAGLILEDVIRGTVVDKMLQPLARAEEGGKALFALLGPPALVTAIALQPDYQVMLLPALRESLRTWIEVAGPKFTEAAARDAAFEEEYGQDIDAFIQMLFAPSPGQAPADDGPGDGPSEDDIQREGMRIVRGMVVDSGPAA